MDNKLPDTRPFAGFEWMLARRYLRARRKEGFISVISLFSFLGILLGVATLIVVMAVLNGFRQELLSKVLGFSGHVSVYANDLSTVTNYKDIQQRLEAIPGVTQVIGLVEGQAMAASMKSATGTLVRGISEADIKKLASLHNESLRTSFAVPGIPDETPGFTGFDESGGVVIGERMAWRHQLGMGSTLTVISPNGPDTIMGSTPRFREYPVVGIFKVGMSDYDENVIYMPLSEAQDYFLADGGVTQIDALVTDPDRIDDFVVAFQEAAGTDMQVQTWKQRNLSFFSALDVERNVMFLVLTMIVLVAAMNIISGLIMLVKDKSRDIAILRTMGATKGAIQRVFMLTGAAIGVAGTIAGLLFGLVICLNAESIRRVIEWISGSDPFNAELYFLSKLPVKMDSLQTGWVVLMALALSFLATLYPSWRAAKLDPVEALRYE
jgi:lipoprotein-releasing system permease protein